MQMLGTPNKWGVSLLAQSQTPAIFRVFLMSRDKLSEKHKAFLADVLETNNPAQSYLNIYDCKETSAASGASALMKRPIIQAELERMRKKAESISTVNAERVLSEEQRLAYYDIIELFGDGYIPKPPKEIPEEIRRALVKVEVKQKVGKKATTYTYKYTMADKGKSLERLERHLGLFEKDNQQKAQAPVLNINFAGRQSAEDSRIAGIVREHINSTDPKGLHELLARELGVPVDVTP